MAWTAMPTFTPGPLTAAQLNVLVANINESAAAKATTAGRIFVATGTNAIAERAVGSATVNASETTASAGTMVDLATVGPTISSLTTGTTVMVILSAFLANNTAGANSQMGFEVTGASSVVADPNRALIYESGAANDLVQCSYALPVAVTAGSNTFKAKYQVSAGTGTFNRRHMIVLPFG